MVFSYFPLCCFLMLMLLLLLLLVPSRPLKNNSFVTSLILLHSDGRKKRTKFLRMTGNISIVHKCGENGQCNSEGDEFRSKRFFLLSLSQVVLMREPHVECRVNSVLISRKNTSTGKVSCKLRHFKQHDVLNT